LSVDLKKKMRKSLQANQRALTCVEFENRVNELLDSRQDPSVDASLNEHSKECGDCENFANRYAIFGQLEVAVASNVVAAKPKRRLAGSEKRLAVLSLVAAAMLVCGLLLVDVSQSDQNGPAVVMLDEIAAPDSEIGEDAVWEVGPTESAPIASPNEGEKMPASLQAGQAFASTNLTAVSWLDLEKNLESLQPVFGYSRRIPVVSSVQSTVDLTIGLIRAKNEQGEFPSPPKGTAPDYGLLLYHFDSLA
jgi:hypothetical protein